MYHDTICVIVCLARLKYTAQGAIVKGSGVFSNHLVPLCTLLFGTDIHQLGSFLPREPYEHDSDIYQIRVACVRRSAQNISDIDAAA